MASSVSLSGANGSTSLGKNVIYSINFDFTYIKGPCLVDRVLDKMLLYYPRILFLKHFSDVSFNNVQNYLIILC